MIVSLGVLVHFYNWILNYSLRWPVSHGHHGILGKSEGSGIIRALLSGVFPLISNRADVAELVDALDLGSSIVRCGSSSLPVRTRSVFYTIQ